MSLPEGRDLMTTNDDDDDGEMQEREIEFCNIFVTHMFTQNHNQKVVSSHFTLLLLI